MLSTDIQRGFEAYVTREDGTRYEEHQIGHSPSATSCFLQSEEGKHYTIHLDATAIVRRLNPKHDWIIAFRVDGRLILQLAHRRGVIGVVCSELHVEEDDQILQGRLVFAKVPTTDDDDKVTLDNKVKEGLGDIRVDIYDGMYAREVAWKKPVLAKTDVGVAKESLAKRLGFTDVAFKTPYQVPERSKAVDFVYNDPTKPFYSFVFNYRTKTALQILQVIEPDEPAVVNVKVEKKKRKRTGVIVVHATDSESGEGMEDTAGNEASDDEISAMERRLNAMEAMLRKANEQDKRDRQRWAEPEELVDITGDDSEDE